MSKLALDIDYFKTIDTPEKSILVRFYLCRWMYLFKEKWRKTNYYG